jgi:hypothetical protein
VDLTTVVMPGAQSLVTAILTDSWGQVRTAVARLWARRQPGSPDPDATALEQARRELDNARQQAVTLAGDGSEAERARRMELFWAGYLAGQVSARPELADAVGALPALLGGGRGVPQATVTVSNTISGTVHGNVVQADDICGGIRFG